METIFITGGAGFIGSNFLNYAVQKYPETRFVNIDKLTYAGNLENVAVSTLANYVFERADICDDIMLERLFQTYTPTGIINFAAESNVDKSIESADAFITTNIGGANNLLRLAVLYQIKRFHHISTDEVYGSLAIDAPAFTENHPLAPNNPYSVSKAAADL